MGADDTPPPLLGRTVGRVFELTAIRARWTRGGLYEGRHAHTGRPVWVRVVGGAGEATTSRVVADAAAAAGFGHAGFGGIRTFFTEGDWAFVVLDPLDAEPAAVLVRKGGGLGSNEARRVAEHVLAAVAHAHGRGVVLGWLGADTVHLGPDGKVVLADVGPPSGVLGVRSPEQALGLEPEARSDLWAVGALLYELVSGRPPFDGTDAQALRSVIATGTPRPLRELVPGVDLVLSEVVGRALSSDPGNRPSTAAAFAEALGFAPEKIAPRPAPAALVETEEEPPAPPPEASEEQRQAWHAERRPGRSREWVLLPLMLTVALALAFLGLTFARQCG